MSDRRARADSARPGHLRGAEERVRHLRRPDERADPAHLLLVRDLRARLLVGAVRRQGNTVMQGSQDIAVHVGTLHFPCKAVIEAFGDDIHPGDVFAINDPYLGGTHFNDVRFIRPIFHEGEVIAFAQTNGHWADVGGSVPGSFDVNAKEHFGEGLRIPPVRIWSQGPVPARRRPADRVQHARPDDMRGRPARAGRGHRGVRARGAAPGREVRRRHGPDGDGGGPGLRRAARRASASRSCPTARGRPSTTSTSTPTAREGLVPIKVKLTIDGDQLHYDLSRLASGGRHVPELRLRHHPLGRLSPAPRRSSPTCR